MQFLKVVLLKAFSGIGNSHHILTNTFFKNSLIFSLILLHIHLHKEEILTMSIYDY